MGIFTPSIQLFLNIILIASFLLTAIAIFTPGWRVVRDPAKNGTHQTYYRGLIDRGCPETLSFIACKQMWEGTQVFEKLVFTLYFGAEAAIVGALAWSLVMCGLCCCQPAVVVVIPFVTLLSYTMHLSATLIYLATKYTVLDDGVSGGKAVVQTKGAEVIERVVKQSVGFSLYLAVIATISLFFGTLMSIALVAKLAIRK